MNLVLTFCVATLIGSTLGHGSTGSGNFMASTPCFSFQGQNILWPAGPQGFAGMSSPFGFSNIFSHPLFGGCMPGAMPRPGEPIEASSPSSSHSSDDHSTPSGPAATVKAAETPVETAAAVDTHAATVDTHAATVETHASPAETHAAPVEVQAAPVELPAAAAVPASPVEIHAAPVATAAAHVEVPAPQVIATAAQVETPATPINVEAPVAQIVAPAVVTEGHVDSSVAHVETPAIQIVAPAAPVAEPAAHVDAHAHHVEASVTPVAVQTQIPSVPVADISHVSHTVIGKPTDVHISAPSIVHAASSTAHAIVAPVHHGGKQGVSATHQEASASSEGSEGETPKKEEKSTCGPSNILDGLGPIVESCDIGSLNLSDFGYPLNLSSCDSHGAQPIQLGEDWHIPSHDYHLDDHFHHNNLIDDSFIYGDHRIHHYPLDYGCYGEPSYLTNILPSIGALNASNINDFCNFTDIHVPTVENHVGTCEEKQLCHIPVLNHHTHNVVEEETNHVPITKSRLVPVVQTFLNHIPLTNHYTRPIVDSSLCHVPVLESHIKPIIHHSIHTVPITEKRITPVTHESVVNVPQYIQGLHQDQYDHQALPSFDHGHVHGHDISCGSAQAYRFDGNAFQDESDYEGDGYGVRSVYPDQGIDDFRKHLYLPSQVVSHENEDLYNRDHPSAGSRQDYGSLQETDCVGPCRAFESEGSAQDYFQPDNRGEGEASAPLVHGIPFPERDSEAFSKDSDDYSQHPDYCQ